MNQRFPYRTLPAEPTYADPLPFVYRPVVPITVYGATLTFKTFGMLDTRCAETILPLSLFTVQFVDPDFSVFAKTTFTI